MKLHFHHRVPYSSIDQSSTQILPPTAQPPTDTQTQGHFVHTISKTSEAKIENIRTDENIVVSVQMNSSAAPLSAPLSPW